jgi:threonine/homoserine/homoserine lactone efflux protein
MEPHSLTLLGIVVRGMLLGLSLAVPLGPINLEIIRRGLSIRPRAGYVIGLGACTCDGLYALLAGLSLSALLRAQALVVVCQAAGALLLGWLAWGALRHGWRQWHAAGTSLPGGAPPQLGAHALLRGYLTGVAMTATSPLNVIFWLTVPARFFAGQPVTPPLVLLTSASVLLGTFCWVTSLTLLLTLGRRLLSPPLLALISLAGGLGLAGFALWSALGALRALT